MGSVAIDYNRLPWIAIEPSSDLPPGDAAAIAAGHGQPESFSSAEQADDQGWTEVKKSPRKLQWQGPQEGREEGWRWQQQAVQEQGLPQGWQCHQPYVDPCS